jgi:outer membrane protein
MKRFIGIVAFAIIVSLAGQNALAQNVKFGHINKGELIQSMPDYDSATVKFTKFRQELINALELMTVEWRNKNETYIKESKNLSDIVKQAKENELTDMNGRIQEFQTTAQTQLTDKEAELYQPVVIKVDKAIKDVGKENGFIYVFDTTQGTLLYFDETKSTNVLSLVRAKLGLK